LVGRKIEHLSVLAEEHLAFDDSMNALKADVMGFDVSSAGKLLRRQIGASQRAMYHNVATTIKLRKDMECHACESDGNGDSQSKATVPQTKTEAVVPQPGG
jgi:hypothetical protein